MSDNSELKKLAEAAVGKSYISGEKFFFSAEATPERVLALITENERSQEKYVEAGRLYLEMTAERDHLKAENAGLKTGYEAYEQVVQGLKAENEALRADAERANYWKQRAKSAEGHLFAGDWRAAALELHRYSRFESTPWPELTGQQRALICSAAGSVIACVNAMRAARKPKDGADSGETIWCECGDGHAANSYGAGFMAANGGVCENCDAAQPKVSCPLELFEGLRDSASEEAEQHRQCMGSYRPHRQEVLDAVVRQCDELISGVSKEAQS